MKNLVYPFDEDSVRALKAGDAVSITGRIYTGRDKFHKFFADGGKLPVDFHDGALYHCGPVVVGEQGTGNREQGTGNGEQGTGNREQGTGNREQGTGDGERVWKVMAAGPTTSVRENPYEPDFIAKSGVRLIIGKGGMDAKTLAAMKKHGCVYIQAVGGGGAVYADAIKQVPGVSLLEEFGAAEAVWHLDVVDFRGVVAMDACGRSLFAEVAAQSEKVLTDLI